MVWRENLFKSIKELRFLFCQTSLANTHNWDFILKNYTDLKTKNLKFPIVTRECSQPIYWCGDIYALGRSVVTAGQINAKLEELAKAG